MKRVFFRAALLYVFSASQLFARIGEDFEQVTKRYGGSTRVSAVDELGNFIRRYEFEDFAIVVTFENRVSVYEVFTKKDQGRIHRDEVTAILAANVPAGATWKVDRLPEFNTSDGNLHAVFVLDQFHIWTKDYHDRLVAARERAKKKKLKGF